MGQEGPIWAADAEGRIMIDFVTFLNISNYSSLHSYSRA